MSDSADVRSLDQLQNLRERCLITRAQTLKGAELLLSELHKLSRWLETEAAEYWQHQATLSGRVLRESEDALLRCESAVRSDEKRPCTNERRRVEWAQQRRELCQQKLKILGDVRSLWQRQVVKLRGRMQATTEMAESELLRTAQQLDSIILTLQAYARVASPTNLGSNASATSETVATSGPSVTSVSDGTTESGNSKPLD